MRIIAGTARGRPLKAPKGSATRPTPDRVREALFSILGERVVGARVLDLFAGSGALGIEALSRGSSHATFVERDRRASAIVRENLELIPHADAQILCISALAALSQLAKHRTQFDLAFLDPPYDSNLMDKCLPQLLKGALMASGALVICEHAGQSPPPACPPHHECVDQRRYGDVALTFIRRTSTS